VNPSEWNPEDIGPALFRIAVDSILEDPDMLSAVVDPLDGRAAPFALFA
jgi:hypothetical protein